MKKQTKILLGVGVLGVGAYLLWKSQQKKSFANYMKSDRGCGCCKDANGKITRVIPPLSNGLCLQGVPNCFSSETFYKRCTDSVGIN